MPNMIVIRPADANEVVEAWRVAIKRRGGPTLMAFTRQRVPTLDRSIYSPASGLQRGAYTLADLGEDPELILMASGSEVDLIVRAGAKLAEEGTRVRLVSFPSWELFELQDKKYQDSVLDPVVTARMAVEAGSILGWREWVGRRGKSISIEKFGASAPSEVLFEKYGFSVANVVKEAKSLLE
jgi:transketolase